MPYWPSARSWLPATFVHDRFYPRQATPAGLQATQEKKWRDYAVGPMRIGPAATPITVTEFSDFECPVCLRFSRALDSMRARYPGAINVVYRNYPLNELHPQARAAALAATCAAQQGSFEAYHDYLFTHQDSLKYLDWTKVAESVGVADTSAFATCLMSPSTREELARDSVAAAALDIPGTPLVLVNEWLFRGAPSLALLEKTVKDELAKAGRVAMQNP